MGVVSISGKVRHGGGKPERWRVMADGLSRKLGSPRGGAHRQAGSGRGLEAMRVVHIGGGGGVGQGLGSCWGGEHQQGHRAGSGKPRR